MVPPSLQEHFHYLFLQPPSCILLSQEQEQVGVPAPLLSLLSPLLASLLAQTQDPIPFLFLPCSARAIRKLLDSLLRGKELEQGATKLAAILGITNLEIYLWKDYSYDKKLKQTKLATPKVEIQEVKQGNDDLEGPAVFRNTPVAKTVVNLKNEKSPEKETIAKEYSGEMLGGVNSGPSDTDRGDQSYITRSRSRIRQRLHNGVWQSIHSGHLYHVHAGIKV